MIKEISSVHNDLIKDIIQLQVKSRVRKKKGLFVIEGLREINLALASGYTLKSLLFCEEIILKTDLEKLMATIDPGKVELIRITLPVYERLAHRKTTEGIVAVSIVKELFLSDIILNKNPLILVAEASEKPGNLGALFRTADAANLDAVIIANPVTDLYNPNIIRSSVGCVFTNQIATGSTDEILAFLKKKKINIYAAALDKSSKAYDSIGFTGPSAIVVGTEATGLSPEWISQSTENIIIPMQGKIDSLNVSVSAAIIIFEAKRQRKSNIHSEGHL
jgi:TrmH family RNA methyltransferase